ncbi:MAG: Pycsar system effector family protein [Pirellulaceae bacterium]
MSNETNDFIWQVHSYTCSFIQFADRKAAILFAWCSGLIAWLFSQHEASKLLTIERWAVDWISALVLSVAVVLLSLSAFFAIRSIKPIKARNIPTKLESPENPDELVYWRSIRALPPDRFIDAINARSFLEKSAARHLYELAGIADIKFRRIAVSSWLAVPGTVATLLALAILS